MTNWTDLTDYLPDGFALREGAGGGDPRNGMCYMETVAFIAGEDVTDEPKCACPVLTNYGIALNDTLPDDVRQRLIPLAWATAGTRSPEHEQARLAILGVAACDIAEMVLPIFEAERPDDNCPRKAIEAARAHWAGQTLEAVGAVTGDAATAAVKAARTASGPAARAARAAAMGANVVVWTADGGAVTGAATWAAARAANTAACAATNAMRAAPHLAPQIYDRAIQALRDAIEAGPHGGIPKADAIARIEARRDELVGIE